MQRTSSGPTALRGTDWAGTRMGRVSEEGSESGSEDNSAAMDLAVAAATANERGLHGAVHSQLRSQSERQLRPGATRRSLRRTNTSFMLRSPKDEQRREIDGDAVSTRRMNIHHQNAHELFTELDRDNDGKLDIGDAAYLAHKLGVHMTKQDVKRAFEEMDEDGDGDVTFSEFSRWWGKVKEGDRRKARREVLEAFEKLDRNRDGEIDKTDFTKLMKGKSKKMVGLLGRKFDLEEDWLLLHDDTIERMRRAGHEIDTDPEASPRKSPKKFRRPSNPEASRYHIDDMPVTFASALALLLCFGSGQMLTG